MTELETLDGSNCLHDSPCLDNSPSTWQLLTIYINSAMTP